MGVTLHLLLLAAAASAAPAPPSLSLDRDEMRENLETLCREVGSSALPTAKLTAWRRGCEEARGRLDSVDGVEAYYRLLDRLVAGLGDSHTRFLNFPFPALAYGVGAAAVCGPDGFYLGAVAPGSPAAKAGLKPGDELLAVEGRPPPERLARARDLLPGASTEPVARLEGCQHLLQSDRLEPLGVTVRRSSGPAETFSLDPARGLPPEIPPPPLPGDCRQLETLEYCLHQNALIVRFRDFRDRSGRAFQEYRVVTGALAGRRGLVLDLRGNPGGFGTTPRRVASTLIGRPMTSSRRRDDAGPDAERIVEETLDPHPDVRVGTPVAAVTDATTQSAAELFAVYLAYLGVPRAGAPTGGLLGASDSEIALPCGLRLRLETGAVLLPDGLAVEGRGVPPDLEVPVSARDRFEGRDPALDAALELLRAEPGK